MPNVRWHILFSGYFQEYLQNHSQPFSNMIHSHFVSDTTLTCGRSHGEVSQNAVVCREVVVQYFLHCRIAGQDIQRNVKIRHDATFAENSDTLHELLVSLIPFMIFVFTVSFYYRIGYIIENVSNTPPA